MTVNDISAPREGRCNNLRTVRDQICRRNLISVNSRQSFLILFPPFLVKSLKIERRTRRFPEHRVRTIVELIPNEVTYGLFGK